MNYLKLFFLLFALIGSAQDYTSGYATYGVEMGALQIDTSKVENNQVKSVIIQQHKKKKRLLNEDIEFFKLTFDSNYSRFETIERLSKDNDPDWKYVLNSDVYVYDFMNGNFQIQKSINGKNYILTKSNDLNWKITEETKRIRGYHTRKAVVEVERENGIVVKIVAWFTSDLPINLGPLHYNGLPGLIIELQELDKIYYLKNIQSKKLITTKKLSGKSISKTEYDELIENAVRF